MRDPVRGGVVGVPPIPGRLLPWQRAALADGPGLAALLDEHGSPVNLIDPTPIPGHAAELVDAAARLGVDLRVFFARKANKAIAVAETALSAGHGVDVASERELAQLLERGADPSRLILTAAVKPDRLLALAAGRGVVISVDNHDELAALRRIAGGQAAVALRMSAPSGLPASRFGFAVADLESLIDDEAIWSELRLAGVHFHLHGYAATDRAPALDVALDLVDRARGRNLAPQFIDIGGGIPIRYLDEPGPWEEFWRAHTAALLGDGPSVTWQDHPLGRKVGDGQVTGQPALYPLWQERVRGDWLTDVLTAPSQRGGSLADRFARADRRSGGALRLHVEPGRALLDGCGLTVARVAFRKRGPEGDWLIGLEMNRTQCRSAALDFLIDPVLVPQGTDRSEPGEGFLVGAYCIEAELLTWRRLRIPRGVAVGDLVVFVNTAGYQMHILESASHQIPLARNLIPGSRGWMLDPIDEA